VQVLIALFPAIKNVCPYYPNCLGVEYSAVDPVLAAAGGILGHLDEMRP